MWVFDLVVFLGGLLYNHFSIHDFVLNVSVFFRFLFHSNTCLTINSPILKRILLHNLMRILHKSWEVFIKILIQIFYVLTWLGAGFYEIPHYFVNISYTSGGKEFFTSFIFLRRVFNSANKFVCSLVLPSLIPNLTLNYVLWFSGLIFLRSPYFHLRIESVYLFNNLMEVLWL